MKTGKIKFYTPKGKGKPFLDKTGKETILDQYLVGFADGNEYKFYADGNWKYEVGTEISYEVSNEQYKTARGAKLINTSNTQTLTLDKPVGTQQSVSMRATTNDSIILQVCYKENMQAFGKENRSSVIKNTQEDFLSLKQILNNI